MRARRGIAGRYIKDIISVEKSFASRFFTPPFSHPSDIITLPLTYVIHVATTVIVKWFVWQPACVLREQPMALEQEHEQRIEAIVKIPAGLYEKAVAYTNVIIIAGYAAFFAVWANTKTYLGKRETLWAALLMTVSIIFFVLWETTKMFVTTRGLMKLRNELNNARPETFVARLDELKNAESRLYLKLLPIWYVVLAVCVISGISADVILINGFLRELIYS
jgi:hypothetical protein